MSKKNKKNDIKNINSLSKFFKVQVVLVREKIKQFPVNWAGTFVGETIFLNTKNKIDYLSVFFHELAHILCIREKKMKFFHSFNHENSNSEAIQKFNKLLPRAEREIDLIALKLMRKFFPKHKFQGYYL